MQIINKLEHRLKQELPGIKAQYEMLPAVRLKDMNKSSDSAKKSAVLLMLYEKYNKIYVCLMVRAGGKNLHSGQISFPGGRHEDFDNSVVITALREANEEVGVDSKNIKILGNLTSVFIPVSNYMVFPTVGYYVGTPKFRLNKTEVAELLEVPLEKLLDDKNKKLCMLNVRGSELEAPIFEVDNYKIWGATAMIINEFLEVLRSC